jgi:hypothetical protein
MMNLNLIIDLEYFQFGPLILRIYILVPGLYEITVCSLVLSRQN